MLDRAEYFAVCFLGEHNQAKILCVFPRLELEEGLYIRRCSACCERACSNPKKAFRPENVPTVSTTLHQIAILEIVSLSLSSKRQV